MICTNSVDTQSALEKLKQEKMIKIIFTCMLKTLRQSKQDELRTAQVLLSVGSFARVRWPSPFLYWCHQDIIPLYLGKIYFPIWKLSQNRMKSWWRVVPLSPHRSLADPDLFERSRSTVKETLIKERIVDAAVLCACVGKETIVAGCLQSWYCKPHDRWVKCWLQSSNIWNSE